MPNPRDLTSDLHRLKEWSAHTRDSGTKHPPRPELQPFRERIVSRDLAVWISYALVVIMLVGEVVVIMAAYRSGLD